MDLRTDFPYWLINDGMVGSYNSLAADLRTDIVVLGGGITGALVAHHLLQAGMAVTVVDKRHIATGSTAATTGLLQYEIDKPLHKLAKLVGNKRAIGSYQACYGALDDFNAMIRDEQWDCGYKQKPSLQFASVEKDMKDLQEEQAWRKNAGIESDMVSGQFIRDAYGFDAPAGLLSPKAADVDAYALAQGIFSRHYRRGLDVFHNTTIVHTDHTAKGVILTTDRGHTIRASRLVIACGYESQNMLSRKVEKILSTYVTISEPYSQKQEHWFKDSLIWETATPYLYIRTTRDNRIIVGGKDDNFYDPKRRTRNAPLKAKALEKKFRKLFAHIPFRTDYYWAGVFGVTRDSLPYIGAVAEKPRTYFALGFGGNGIIYSLIAAAVIRDLIQNKFNPAANLFSFNR